MKYLIGCPIYKRDWLLPLWFEAIENQTVPLKDIGFLFLMAPEEDDPDTYKIVFDWQAKHPETPYFNIYVDQGQHHKAHAPGMRAWRFNDYKKMSNFRNVLLEHVRRVQPENYFSLDSDILITNPETLETLSRELVNYNAVSPLSYMSPASKAHPNVMSWRHSPGRETIRLLDRYPIGKTFKADIIMAAVMMDPEAYTKSKYQMHPAGEDPGWAFNMWTKKLTMASVSSIYAPHIMHKDPPRVTARNKAIFKDAPGLLENYLLHGDRRGDSFTKDVEASMWIRHH
jgi:hypothetical protein